MWNSIFAKYVLCDPVIILARHLRKFYLKYRCFLNSIYLSPFLECFFTKKHDERSLQYFLKCHQMNNFVGRWRICQGLYIKCPTILFAGKPLGWIVNIAFCWHFFWWMCVLWRSVRHSICIALKYVHEYLMMFCWIL